MFVLLQTYPPEAVGDDDLTPLDVVMVDGSCERLEEYLTGYRKRYQAASVEFAAWDRGTWGTDEDWTTKHDRKQEMIARKHGVHGSLMPGTTFEIAETLALGAAYLPALAISLTVSVS